MRLLVEILNNTIVVVGVIITRLWHYLFLVIILSVTSISLSSIANDDFHISILGEQNNTTLIPVGKSSLDLRVSIGEINYSEYHVTYYSPLFLFSYPISENGNVHPNSSHDYQIDIDPSSDPGRYIITFIANITTKENISRTFFINKSISYVSSLVLLDVSLPSEHERDVQVSIRTYMFFDEISMVFNTDGDVGIDPKIITLYNLSQGTYQFNSTVHQIDIGYGNQEIGFKVIAFYNSQFFEIIEENVNVEILWEEEDQNDGGITNWATPFILIICLVLVNLYFLNYMKRGKK